MKLLFILFSLLINLFLYCGPALLLHAYFRKSKQESPVLTELESKAGLRLASLPFLIWFILFLFDPTQKTVQQLIFLDPLLIGLLTTLLLMAEKKIIDPVMKRNMNITFTLFAILFSILCFFYINPNVA